MPSAGLLLVMHSVTSVQLDPHNPEPDPVHVLPHACSRARKVFKQKPRSRILEQEGGTRVQSEVNNGN